MPTDQPSEPGESTSNPLHCTVAPSAARGNRGRASLLPGRPPDDVVWAGPKPEAAGSRRPLLPVRAICCSGGGIRAAAFSLGGLQYLNARKDGDGTVYSKTDLVTSVSGGGYTAGSYALVKHSLDPDEPADAPRVYAPGSPEDNRLRAHARYRIDSKTQLTVSMMGIVYGLLMNLAAILAVVFIAATLEATVLGAHGLNALRVDPNGSTFTATLPGYLPPAVLVVLGLGCLVYLLYRLWDMYRRPLGEVGTTRWCVVSIVLIAVSMAGLVLLIGVPSLLGALNHTPTRVSSAGAKAKTGTFVATIVALVGIIQQLIRTYVPATTAAAASDAVGAALKKEAGSFASRFASKVLPWLGSLLITMLLAVAFLTWVAAVVKTHHETMYWACAAGTLLFLLIWRLLTDGNRTSLHRPYTQRLASAFGVTRDGDDCRDRLSMFATDRDTPRLVICAAVNTDQPGSTPTGRQCAPFTFSAFTAGISSGTMFGGPNETGFDLAAREISGPDRRLWNTQFAVGSTTSRDTSHEPSLWMQTKLIEDHADTLSVMDMVAVSGAAVAPAMGRMSRPSLRLLLGVANVRLGMWLPNPLHRRRVHPPNEGLAQRIWWQLRQPGLGSLLKEIVGGLSLKGRWVYVTDGGHYENLGLVEALRRGATDIIVFDASGDKPFTLSTFGQAVETARADLGVEIELAPGALSEVGRTGMATSLAACAKARYANGVVASIYVCKAAMTAGLPHDLVGWHQSHPEFPNTTTADQFYGDREFEAYRKLGWIAAKQACTVREADLGRGGAEHQVFATSRYSTRLPVIARRRRPLPRISR